MKPRSRLPTVPIHILWFSNPVVRRWLHQEWRIAKSVFLGITFAVLSLCYLFFNFHVNEISRAYMEGAAEAVSAYRESLPVLLTSDQALANTMCTRWWFGMNSKQRTLIVPHSK